MTVRCAYCGEPLPPEAIEWPSGECVCEKCRAQRNMDPRPAAPVKP